MTIENGGILAPGDAPGTLTTGTLTLNSGSVSDFELGAPNVVGAPLNDLVDVNGNLTLAGTLDIANSANFGSFPDVSRISRFRDVNAIAMSKKTPSK